MALLKGKRLIGVSHLQFRGSVHYHQGRKQGSMQAGLVLEPSESPYRLIQQQQGVNWDTGHSLNIYETSKSASIVTHFLQQGHTPNRVCIATSFGGFFSFQSFTVGFHDASSHILSFWITYLLSVFSQLSRPFKPSHTLPLFSHITYTLLSPLTKFLTQIARS